MGCLLYAVGALALVAVTVVGMFGVASAGFCDTSCPSDSALAIYRVMFFGGGAAFAALTAVFVAGWLRNRR